MLSFRYRIFVPILRKSNSIYKIRKIKILVEPMCGQFVRLLKGLRKKKLINKNFFYLGSLL